jgi:hypothetical protein
VTLDALSLLHPAGPGVERPAHPAEPGDDPVPRRRPTRLPVAKQLSGSTRLLEGVAGSISLVDGDAGYTG